MATRRGYLKRSSYSAYDPTVLTIPTDDVTYPAQPDGSVDGSVSSSGSSGMSNLDTAKMIGTYSFYAFMAFVTYKIVKS